jgi:hypothetical protein
MKILGISGSLRKDSWNTALLHTAASLAFFGKMLVAFTAFAERVKLVGLSAAHQNPQSCSSVRLASLFLRPDLHSRMPPCGDAVRDDPKGHRAAAR